MECDSVHSVLERKLKGMPLYSLSSIISIIEQTKYELEVLDRNFFKNFTDIGYYQSIRPGNHIGDPQVNDFVALRYSPDADIHYKLNFVDEWDLLPRRSKPCSYKVTALHDRPVGMKQRKYDDLQDLKSVIPKWHHEFSDNLHVMNA